MKRRRIPTALILLSVLSGSLGGVGLASGTPQTDTGVSIKAELAAAARQPKSKGSKVTSFITVFTEADGTKYALIDQTVPGAPAGEIVVNGAQLKELGLKRIDYVTRRYGPPAKAVKPPALNPAPVAAETGDVGADNRARTWWAAWGFDHNVRTWNSYARAGGIAIGCENKTNRVVHVHCTLSNKATDTVTVSSKLTFDQILEIGFERGRTAQNLVRCHVLCFKEKERDRRLRYRVGCEPRQIYLGWAVDL